MPSTGATVDARRAGARHATKVTPMPTISAATSERGGEDEPLVGEAEPRGLEEGLETDCDDEAEADAEDGGQRSDDQRLDHDGGGDLGPARTEGAQESELAGALPDDDGERVVDEEGGHEQGDGGEAEQDVLEGVHEALDALARLVLDLGTGHRLDPLRERRLDAVGEVGRVDVGFGDDVDGVDLTLGAEDLGCDVDVERGQAGTEEVVGLTEGEDPDDLHLGLGAVGQEHGGVIAHGEAVVLGRPTVDGHLSQAVRGSPGVERDGPQRVLVAPGDAEERSPGGGEGLSVEVDQLRVAADPALCRLHAVDLAHDIDERGGHPTASDGGVPASTQAEAGLGSHGHIDTAGDVLEELVDGPAKGVGDDEGPDDEPDAHDHREGGEEEAELVGDDVAEAEAEHQAPTASCGRGLARWWAGASRQRRGRRPGTRCGRHTRPRRGRG